MVGFVRDLTLARDHTTEFAARSDSSVLKKKGDFYKSQIGWKIQIRTQPKFEVTIWICLPFSFLEL